MTLNQEAFHIIVETPTRKYILTKSICFNDGHNLQIHPQEGFTHELPFDYRYMINPRLISICAYYVTFEGCKYHGKSEIITYSIKLERNKI